MTLLLEPRVAPALEALRAGSPVLVYDADGREEEVDMFVRADAVGPAEVRLLRRDAGGLVFLAVDASIASRFGLPFLQDVLEAAARDFPLLGRLRAGALPYDARSAFSLTLNHRATFTGITDRDRALTIRRFAELAAEVGRSDPGEAAARLGEEFRAPGHVHLCVAREPLLEARRGHTELACALARMAGLPGVLAGAEMLDGDLALSRERARAWARERRTVLVEGPDVQAAWASFIKRPGHGRA